MSKALKKRSKRAVRRLSADHPFRLAQNGTSPLRNGAGPHQSNVKRIGGRRRTCHVNTFDPTCAKCIDRVRSQQARDARKAERIAKTQGQLNVEMPSKYKTSKYERLNELGRCEAQAIFKIRTLVAQLGRFPTMDELKECGLERGTLRRQFGGIEGVKMAIGYDDQVGMLKSIRAVAAELGHTPRANDLPMFGISVTTLINHFGSLARAQEKAGLYPNKPNRVMALPAWFNTTESLGGALP